MREVLVSVIIPVYNAEKYIENVLEDIIAQTYTNLEIIVVNDGSTDNSLLIVENIVKKDKRIKLINIDNCGVSRARNIGLDMATGDYVRFIDADDRVDKASIRQMVEAFNDNSEADLVIGNYTCVPMRNYMTGVELTQGKVNETEFVTLFSKYAKSFYFGVTWNKLYKREIIQKYKLYFNETLRWCEDFIFNIDYFSHCSIFYILKTENGIYEYNMRSGSLTDSPKKDSDKLYVKNIRYKKMLEYCSKYIDEEILILEWKYAELFSQLSQITSIKHKEKNLFKVYRKFKILLSEEDVYKYVCIKEKNDASVLWRKIKRSIEKKKYLSLFFIFFAKEFIKDYLSVAEKFLRKKCQKLLPQNF